MHEEIATIASRVAFLLLSFTFLMGQISFSLAHICPSSYITVKAATRYYALSIPPRFIAVVFLSGLLPLPIGKLK